MEVSYIINKILNSITYILPTGNNKDCYLVDCGDAERIIDDGWNVLGVLLTHAHTDHIYGINTLLKTFPNAIIYTNEDGKEGLMNPKWNFSRYHDEVEDFIISSLQNVQVIEKESTLHIADNLTVEVLFTPGHEPSCLSFIIGNNIFTGDAYIPGVMVVTSFPRSNKQQATSSLQRLKTMEDCGAKIMPGHSIANIYSLYND